MNVDEIKNKLRRGYVIVKLKRFESRNTEAFIRYILPEDYTVILSTHDAKKTHWEEYILIHRFQRIIEVKKSNRGNYYMRNMYARDLALKKPEVEQLLNILSVEK